MTLVLSPGIMIGKFEETPTYGRCESGQDLRCLDDFALHGAAFVATSENLAFYREWLPRTRCWVYRGFRRVDRRARRGTKSGSEVRARGAFRTSPRVLLPVCCCPVGSFRRELKPKVTRCPQSQKRGGWKSKEVLENVGTDGLRKPPIATSTGLSVRRNLPGRSGLTKKLLSAKEDVRTRLNWDMVFRAGEEKHDEYIFAASIYGIGRCGIDGRFARPFGGRQD